MFSQFFLTHVEPLHPLQGKEVLFTVREQNPEQGIYRSHIVIKEIPHYFFTPNLPLEEAEKLIVQLKQDPAFSHLQVEKLQYNTVEDFLRVAGSKEDREILPPPFLCQKDQKDRRDPLQLNSPAKLLRWFYPPFLLVDSPSEIPLPLQIKKRQYASLESLVNDTYVVIDLETEGWKTGPDKIFMAVYLSTQRKVILHDLPFTEKKQEDFDLLQVADQKEFGQALTALMQEDDPLWIFGHNIMNFDQLKLREKTRAYYPGTNEQYPVIKSTQVLGKVITKGRLTLDTYAYMKNYLNLFADNKLETLMNFKKSINYEEQAELVVRARQGEPEAFKTNVHYVLEDCLQTEKAAKKFREMVVLKALHFRRDPDSICATSKLTLAEDYWKRRQFLIKKTFEDGWKKKPRYTKKAEEKFSLDFYKNSFLRKDFWPGFFPHVQVLYLTPFVAGGQDLLREISPKILERFQKTSDSLEKFDLLQTLNVQLTYLVEESLRILGEEKKLFEETLQVSDRKKLSLEKLTLSEVQRKKFYCLFTYHGLYGSYRYNPELFLKNICSAFEKTNRALQQYRIVNRSKQFYFVRGSPQVEKLERLLFGCSLGYGPALSLARGKIIADPEKGSSPQRFIYQSIKLNRGEKCNFEKRVLGEVVKKIFSWEGFTQVKEYLDTEINSFLSGRSSPEDYYVAVKRRTYYKNLLGETLGKSSLEGGIKKAYEKLKPRIGDRFSPLVRKELSELIKQSRGDYSYPFLLEAWESIKEPYPPQMDLVYAGKDLLLPVSWGAGPDLEVYREKINDTFSDIYDILKTGEKRFEKEKRNYFLL